MKKKLWILLFLCSTTLQAQLKQYESNTKVNKPKMDLMVILDLAICNDPTVLAAKQAQLAALEALPQAAAQFLPVLDAQSYHTSNYNNGAGFIANNPITVFVGKVGGYNSNFYTLSLKQPVFHFEHWEKYIQASDQVKQANATYASAQQDLMLRSAAAYFAVLQAIDTYDHAVAQVTALQKFYDQTNERFKVGLIAITDVQIAKARHDSAVAQKIVAETGIATQIEKLKEIIGCCADNLATLKTDVVLTPPDPADIDCWVDVALNQNLDLKAALFKAMVTRSDIKLSQFNHLPTVDILGSVVRTNPTNQVQFKNTTSSIGFQVNFPLFRGGGVMSKTSQAIHTFLQTDKQAEIVFRTVQSNARQFYLNVLTAISQVKALNQAVVSNQSALDATEASFNVGARTIVDVLNAQTDLIQAKQNLSVAKYNYILQTLQLKRVAGTLSPDDLCQINTWLEH